MKTDLTEIAYIMDRSGSMQSLASDAIGGYNSFLADQQSHPGQASWTLILFDHEYQVVHQSVDIRLIRPLDNKTYIPRGTTALLDAMGRTIDDLGARLAATPEPERPGKVIVTIMTDGLENASHDYTRERIASMIRHQREKYSWEFIFQAANQDAITTAAALSIDAKDAFNFAATPQGIRDAHSQMSAEIKRRRG